MILKSGMVIPHNLPFKLNTESLKNLSTGTAAPRQLNFELRSYGMPKEILKQILINHSSNVTSFQDSAFYLDSDQLSDDSSDSRDCSE